MNTSAFLKKIKNSDFRFEPPYFYNNEYALRCELGIGKTRKEFKKNAFNRAVEIFNLVFTKEPELFFFNYIIYDNSELGFNYNNLKKLINYYKKDMLELAALQLYGYEIIKNIKLSCDDLENNAVKCNRFIVFTENKNINYIELLKKRCEDHESRLLHFVSLEHECIFTIYDNRGLDLVFSSKEKGKHFYYKLKPYLLEYDIETMKRNFED